jgi:type I restriction enzyme S subunit
MGEWIETSLDTLAIAVTRGVSPKYSEVEGIPVINQKCIRNGKIDLALARIHDTNKKFSSEKLLKDGDILINSTGVGTAGRVAIFDEPKDAICDSHVSILRLNADKYVPKFVFYNLRGREKEIEETAEGSTGQIELSRDGIRSLELSIPNDKEEQMAIAEVLSSLDDKIDLLHRQNKTLESLAETLFRHWFIDGAQDDWEMGTLGDVIEIFDSKRIPLSRMERDKMKEGPLYPYYGAASIMDEVNDFIFDGDYILLGEDGTVRTDEGFPILQFATGKFWVNNHAHVLKGRYPYSDYLIFQFLKQTNIDNIVTGAVQPKINQGNLKALVFPMLPHKLLLDFDTQTNQIFKKTKSNNSQIRHLESLRDTLLLKLMSGDVRVDYDKNQNLESAV